MENEWEVIKNFDYEDEEVLLTTEDYLEAVKLVQELSSKSKSDIFGVYPTDEMWRGCL